MATRAKPEVSAEVSALFDSIENHVRGLADKLPLKLQIERDFRGRPVLSVRIRKEGVESEMLPTLRYPE